MIPETSPDADDQHRQQRLAQIGTIRSKLADYRPDIQQQSPVLHAAVTKWIDRSLDVPTSNARNHVTKELSSLRRDHAMYRQTGTTAPGADFPDKCSGCPHSPPEGYACPVLTNNTTLRKWQRIVDEAESTGELVTQLREVAIEHNCHVLHDALDDVEQDHGPIYQQGLRLLMAVQDLMFSATQGSTFVDRVTATLRASATEEHHAGRIDPAEAVRLDDVELVDDTEAVDAGDLDLAALTRLDVDAEDATNAVETVDGNAPPTDALAASNGGRS